MGDKLSLFKENMDAQNYTTVSWRLNAHYLNHAADCLMDKYEEECGIIGSVPTSETVQKLENGFKPIWAMLKGYAFECLLKGQLASYYAINEKDFIKNGQMVDVKTHSFEGMIKALENEKNRKIDFNEGECEFLNRIEQFTTWAGRYPYPLSAKDYFKKGTETPKMTYFKENDVEIANNIFRKLKYDFDEASELCKQKNK